MSITWNHQPLPKSIPGPLSELRYGMCRFPFDADLGALFCCLPVVPGTSWCRGHGKVVFAGMGGK